MYIDEAQASHFLILNRASEAKNVILDDEMHELAASRGVKSF